MSAETIHMTVMATAVIAAGWVWVGVSILRVRRSCRVTPAPDEARLVHFVQPRRVTRPGSTVRLAARCSR